MPPDGRRVLNNQGTDDYVLTKMAQMSNIGGGSKATGGGGVDEGMKAMLQYAQADTAKKMIGQNGKKEISRKR